MFLFRVGSIDDLEVGVVSSGKVARGGALHIARQAEREAASAISLYVRLSFVYTSVGERPEVHGRAFTGPKMRVKCKSYRAEANSKGTLVLQATAEPPIVFFFHTDAVGGEWQLQVEVLAALEPMAPGPSDAAGAAPASRTWRLAAEADSAARAERAAKAAEVAKAVDAGKAAKDAKAAASPRGVLTLAGAADRRPPAGGEASPLDPSVPPPAAVGWAVLRFDLATDLLTESRRPWPKRKLRPGSLREHLLEPSPTGRPLADREARLALDKFLRLPGVVGAVECELEAVPLHDLALRLLPPEFPAAAAALRLGGLSCQAPIGEPLRLVADAGDVKRPDCFLRNVTVTLPDEGWLPSFLRSVELPPGRQGQWELQGLHLLAGMHNALRWLDSSIREIRRSGIPPCPLDDAGRMWRLQLTPLDAGRRWTFGGDVPIEFVGSPDCGLVLELVATVSFSAGPPTTGSPPPGGTLQVQSQTVGWLIALPLFHATDEALQRLGSTLSVASAAVGFELPLRHGPGSSLTGQEVWTWKPVPGQEHLPRPGSVRAAFTMYGDRIVRFLQKNAALRRLRGGLTATAPLALSPVPTTLPPAPAPPPPPPQEPRPAATTPAVVTQPQPPPPAPTPPASVTPRPAATIAPAPQTAEQLAEATRQLLGAPPTQAEEQLKEATRQLLEAPPTQAEVDAAKKSEEAAAQARAQPPADPPPPPTATAPSPPPAPAPEPAPASEPAPAQPQPETAAAAPEAPPPAAAAQPPAAAADPAPAAPAQPAAAAEPQPQPQKLLPELQAIVERVYLRDQGTQSDPPPLYEASDNVISQGRPIAELSKAARTQPYIGPSVQPLGQAERAQLLMELGDSNVGRLLRGARSGEAGPRRDLRWKAELEDPLQVDEITFEFATHRTFAAGAGERIYFQLRFFAFPPLKTQVAALGGGAGEACFLRSTITNERLALTYHVDGAAAFPGPGSAKDMHCQLVEYLASRTAQVEVWNLDAAMQVGLVEVPLDWLVRQGNPVAKTEAELVACDPLTGEPRGFVRVLATCRGRQREHRPQAAEQVPLPGTPMQEPLSTPGSPTPRNPRTRFKAKALADWSQDTARTLLQSAGDSPEETQKKQLKIEQLRALHRVDLPENPADQAAMMSAADDARQERKRVEIARRMEQFNTSRKTLAAPFATPTYFHVDFENPYNHAATFCIIIAERGARAYREVSPPIAAPVQGVLLTPPEQPLCLVWDPEEWRRIAIARLVPPPLGGDFARLAPAAARGFLALGPREMVCLPFRYLAFDHPGQAAEPLTAPSAGVGLADAAQWGAGTAPERTFVVEVLVQQGPVLRRAEITVRPQPCPVARTLRFFEAEGTAIEKALALAPAQPAGPDVTAGRPTFVGQTGRTGRFVLCTDRDVHMQRRDEDEVVFRMLVPQSPQVRSFFVVFYADAQLSRVAAVQLVEVMGMRSEIVRVAVGQSVDRSVCLPPAEVQGAASVSVYSSHPEIVSVLQAHVDPTFGAKFVVAVTASQVGKSTCRIHAVDPATRRRCAAILLVVAADVPEVKLVHELSLPVLTAVRKHLPFKNELPRPMRYKVRSSDPALVTVQTPEMVLPPLGERFVELLFHAIPATLSYSAEVLLFIASEDRVLQETRVLQLTYT